MIFSYLISLVTGILYMFVNLLKVSTNYKKFNLNYLICYTKYLNRKELIN